MEPRRKAVVKLSSNGLRCWCTLEPGRAATICHISGLSSFAGSVEPDLSTVKKGLLG